jgi:hypothetical protein
LVKIDKKNWRNSTGRLGHLDRIHQIVRGKKSNSIAQPVERKYDGFNSKGFEEVLLKFIVKSDQPFTIVEEQAFKEVLFYCRQEEFRIYSAKSISTRLKELYKSKEDHINRLLLNNASRLNFTLDAWTSLNCIAILGITVHWIDRECRLRSCVLSCSVLEGSGADEDPVREGIINENETTPTADIPDIIEEPDNPNICTKLKKTLDKLRKAVTGIRSTPQRRERFYAYLRHYDIDKLDLIPDVPTRWDSTLYMLERARKLRLGVDNMVKHEDNLRKCVLDEDEWVR